MSEYAEVVHLINKCIEEQKLMLDLSCFNITKLPEELLTCTQLTRLYLNDTNITDVSSLAALTNLIRLDIGDNPITDISALHTLTKLNRLYVDGTKITDLTALKDLSNLVIYK